jgi:hypothetical protein
MARTKILISVFGAMLAVTGCGSDDGGGGSGGDVMAGFYSGSSSDAGNAYQVCFYVDDDMIQLVDNSACNIEGGDPAAFEIDVTSGTLATSTGDCDFDIDWESEDLGPIAIDSDGDFEGELTVTLPGVGEGILGFTGTIEGSSAFGTAFESGTATGSAFCSIAWQATHQP